MRNNSNRLKKRLMVLFAGFVAIFGLTSCTKSFCNNQDKANQLYAYYGNLFAETVDLDENTVEGQQNLHRETLYKNIVSSYSGFDKDFLSFMNNKATDFAIKNEHLWTDGTIDSISASSSVSAYDVAFHVGIYAGLTTKNDKTVVSDLFVNLDEWYTEAVNNPAIGPLKAPSSGLMSTLESSLKSAISSNTACITPESGVFSQDDVSIYIEGKSWGQAFAEYGFFEGLLVYPLSWIVHAIASVSTNGWFAILAIIVVTLLVRSVTIVSTVIQTNSQSKQQKIQPLLNELQKKYPNSANDQDQKRALAMEQSQLMKKAKIHPFLPILFMILQFPLFICIWSALQGNAALASGNWLGLHLTTTVSTCFTSYSTTDGALVGIFIFIIMTITNILASFTSLFFTSWRTKNFGTAALQIGPDGKPTDPNKTMKYMTIFMSVFVVIMGWNLPTGMGIYWLLGSLISIVQSVIMEMIQTRSRHKLAADTGDGSTLAAVRRSKHHATAKKKDNKSDKPMWRK